jgi:carboxypeptidase Q
VKKLIERSLQFEKSFSCSAISRSLFVHFTKEKKMDASALTQLKELANTEISNIYKELETLCLCFPARMTGSDALTKAISYLYEDARKTLPEDCCTLEEVKDVTKWVRYGNFGNVCHEINNTPPTLTDLKNRPDERCFLEFIPTEKSTDTPTPYPAIRQIRLLANGLSCGTGPEGVNGEIVIIHDWEELDKEGNAGHLTGKVILYDYRHFDSYGELSAFRYLGGERAIKHGAVAVLVRTLTPDDSLSGPHTGVQSPENDKIPSACISVEDCEMISRLVGRGFQVKATIILPCLTLPTKTISHNLLCEIKGNEKPEEVIVIGGHIDSWDCQYGCCQGAHDDGQAVVLVMNIIKLLTKHGFKPKRTIRAVVFTDEEMCQTGADQYQLLHASEAEKVVMAIETDCGAGPVLGFNYNFHKHSPSFDLLQRILAPVNDLQLLSHQREAPLKYKESYVGMDITPMVEKDLICGLLLKHTDDWWHSTYFHYHHSASDSIDHIDVDLLKENFIVLLVTVWLLANHPESSLLLKSNR